MPDFVVRISRTKEMLRPYVWEICPKGGTEALERSDVGFRSPLSARVAGHEALRRMDEAMSPKGKW